VRGVNRVKGNKLTYFLAIRREDGKEKGAGKG